MMQQDNANALNERSRHVLQVLVEQYIRQGQPVGSRHLARSSGLGLSPASIRNVMCDLEEYGYIRSPHTSAGRIPTERGYRLFVDRLLGMKPDGRQISLAELREQLRLDGSEQPQDLVESVSSFLSGFTRMAGLVTLPRREASTLRYIEFLPLGEQRILVIMVVNDHEVQNRVIHADRDYSRRELERATNYLNQRFGGHQLDAVRRSLERELRAARHELNRMMEAAVAMAGQALSPAEQDTASTDFVLAGETNLMDFDELSDVDKLKSLFETFNRKRDLYDLLERCARADGLQIYIGRESGYEVLDDLSIVTAPYSQGDEVVGVLGVIGPTRMEYDRVISVVDVTSRLLGSALNSRS